MLSLNLPLKLIADGEEIEVEYEFEESTQEIVEEEQEEEFMQRGKSVGSFPFCLSKYLLHR